MAAATVAAAVVTGSFLQMPPMEAPAAPPQAATEVAAATAAPAGQGTAAPSGPLHDLFAAADEVLVVEASPTYVGRELGIEPVEVRQVLKGLQLMGATSVDVASADDGINGSLLWQHSQKEAPQTYLGFFSRGSDGGLRLLDTPHALLQIQNIRTAATVDPVTDVPVASRNVQAPAPSSMGAAWRCPRHELRKNRDENDPRPRCGGRLRAHGAGDGLILALPA